MDDPDKYRTLATPSEGDYREKGSKFLAYAFPCPDEETLKTQLHTLKKQHPSARHFCYAAIIDAEHPIQRSSDAGEPSGTAGLPILNQILSARLLNTNVIVVRYFGGTKLGKPGLIHAYKESTRLALEKATITEQYITRHLEIHFDYIQSGPVMRFIGQLHDTIIIHQEFLETCKVTLAVPKSRVQDVVHLFKRLPHVHVTPLG